MHGNTYDSCFRTNFLDLFGCIKAAHGNHIDIHQHYIRLYFRYPDNSAFWEKNTMSTGVLDALSNREHEILELVAKGLLYKEISTKLGIAQEKAASAKSPTDYGHHAQRLFYQAGRRQLLRFIFCWHKKVVYKRRSFINKKSRSIVMDAALKFNRVKARTYRPKYLFTASTRLFT